MDALTTKDYIVTDDDIEVVEKPSKDIAKDELEQEEKLVSAIVKTWNNLIQITECKTIQFAVVVDKILKDYPDEKRNSIIKKVMSSPKLKSNLSRDRIYQGLRLIRRRPDLINYTPDKNQNIEPYLKEDGSIFWEFYMTLEKYALGVDSKLRLEQQGIKEKWSTRELQKAIYKERELLTGDSKNTYKQDLIKRLIAIAKILDNEVLDELCNHAESLKKRQNGK